MSSSFLRLLIQPRNWLPALGLGLLWLVNLLPFAVKLRVGMALGSILYSIAQRRRHIAAVNLELCFPELSDHERRQLLKDTFRNFGAGLVETAMGWWSPEEKIHAILEFEGKACLLQAMGQGKGVVLVGAHFSTLDLGPKLINRFFDIHAVYRRQKNALINYAMRTGRSSSLLSLLDSRDARKIVRTIREGNILWFAPDHDMGEKIAVYAPFFGQQAATVTITSKFARLTGAPVIFVSSHRNADNKGYTVRLSPIETDFINGDELACATAVNQAIAEHILIDPAQYYWFHRKFKTQPGLEKAALYARK